LLHGAKKKRKVMGGRLAFREAKNSKAYRVGGQTQIRQCKGSMDLSNCRLAGSRVKFLRFLSSVQTEFDLSAQEQRHDAVVLVVSTAYFDLGSDLVNCLIQQKASVSVILRKLSVLKQDVWHSYVDRLRFLEKNHILKYLSQEEKSDGGQCRLRVSEALEAEHSRLVEKARLLVKPCAFGLESQNAIDDSELEESLPDRLSLELKKYSIDEVAEVSKISPRTIGRVRSGVAVSPKIIDALVDCLAVMSEGKSAKRGARRVAMA